MRTHILRLTWHFVARDDIRWMLALSGTMSTPSAPTTTARWSSTSARSRAAATCSSARCVTALLRPRPELGAALRRAGIVASGTRSHFLTLRAELDAVICNGPRRRKELTYALFDERVPAAKPVDRDEALARLATRCSRCGPATLKDYVVVGADGARRKGGDRPCRRCVIARRRRRFHLLVGRRPRAEAAVVYDRASAAQLRRVSDRPQGSPSRGQPRLGRWRETHRIRSSTTSSSMDTSCRKLDASAERPFRRHRMCVRVESGDAGRH